MEAEGDPTVFNLSLKVLRGTDGTMVKLIKGGAEPEPEPGPPPSEGLLYEEVEESGVVVGYSVAGIGTCTDSNLVIPSTYNDLPVTSIGYSAFKNNETFTRVVLPQSIKTIVTDAFTNCKNLESVFISKNVESIGSMAFYNCQKLQKVEFNAIRVNDILAYNSVFGMCNALTNFEIGLEVEYIPSGLISSCSNLTKIIIPSNVAAIGKNAFYGQSALTEIYLRGETDSIPGSPWGAENATIDWGYKEGLE